MLSFIVLPFILISAPLPLKLITISVPALLLLRAAPVKLLLPPAAPLSVREKPFTSNWLPACMSMLLIVTLLASNGYLGAAPGMVTLPAATGTPPVQLPAVFQSVLTLPFHVCAVTAPIVTIMQIISK